MVFLMSEIKLVYLLIRNRGVSEFDSLEALIDYAKIAYLKYPDGEITIKTKEVK